MSLSLKFLKANGDTLLSKMITSTALSLTKGGIDVVIPEKIRGEVVAIRVEMKK